MKIRKIYFLALSVLGMLTTACKDESSETDKSGYTDALVSSFALADNDNYDISLSDVFFTIDQYGVMDEDGNLVGQIYNADSLPVGTETKKMLANIGFDNPSKVTLYTATDTLEYSSSDSINFSSPVKMEVIAGNGNNKKYYTIKVNVHQMLGDSIDWKLYVNDPLADAGTIVDQRALAFGSDINWYVRNTADVVLYTSPTTDLQRWTKEGVTLPAGSDPVLSSLRKFDDVLYMVDAAGNLLGSADGRGWSVVSASGQFVNLIGTINGVNGNADRFIAIVTEGGKYYFSYSTDAANWAIDGELDSKFPISGYSNSLQYFGGTTQRIVIVGGKAQDGTLTSDSWSYDGGKNPWTALKNINSELPALQGASLFEYQSDPRYPDTYWMIMGGQLKDDSYSSTIYYSANKGISWMKASSTISLPSAFEARAFISPYVSSDFFIYLLGGQNAEGELNQIWRGRLNQLTFTPVE